MEGGGIGPLTKKTPYVLPILSTDPRPTCAYNMITTMIMTMLRILNLSDARVWAYARIAGLESNSQALEAPSGP